MRDLINALMKRLRNEPVMFYAVAEALIAVAVAFGLGLTGEQVAAIMAVVAILTGVGARSQVAGPVTYRDTADAEQVISRVAREHPDI